MYRITLKYRIKNENNRPMEAIRTTDCLLEAYNIVAMAIGQLGLSVEWDNINLARLEAAEWPPDAPVYNYDAITNPTRN